jgi:hypothetical protein
MELATKADAAADFVKGIVPKNFSVESPKDELEQKTATILSTVDPKE